MEYDTGNFVVSREKELRMRVEEQHYELESLREQTRDKDAAINFLKTKITSFQNKSGCLSARSLGQEQEELSRKASAEDDLKAMLMDKDEQIEQLRLQVVVLQETFEPQVTALKEVMKQREIVHAEEVKALREQSEGGLGRDEAEELRQRLQFRDEQLHTLGQAYEGLQHQCQMQVRAGEELKRKEEEHKRLSAQLKQASAEIEELQKQLKSRENEVAQLADSLQACREKEWQQSYANDDVSSIRDSSRTNVQRKVDPPSALPVGMRFRHPSSQAAACSNNSVESANLDGTRQGGSSSSRGSPRAPPTPHNLIEPTTTPKAKAAVPVQSIMLEDDAYWAEKVTPLATYRDSSRGALPESLQERSNGVLLLQEKIRNEIANLHGSSQQRPMEPPRPLPMTPSKGGTNRSEDGSPRNSDIAQTLSQTLPAQHAQSSSNTHVVAPSTPEVPRIVVPEAYADHMLDKCEETGSCSAPSSPSTLPLSASARSHPGSNPSRCLYTGRAATASRVERQTKPPSRSGGALVTVNIFDEDDPSQKRTRQQAATQQRVAKQIEQRRRLVKEKAHPDDVGRTKAHEQGTTPPRTASPGASHRTAATTGTPTPTRSRQVGQVGSVPSSTPTQVHRGLFRGPERSATRPGSPEVGAVRTSATGFASPQNSAVRPGSPQAKQGCFRGPERSSMQTGTPVATMKTITGSTSTFLPSSPLIGGSAHVPLGGSTRLLGDTSPSKGMAPFGRAGDSAALPVSGAEESLDSTRNNTYMSWDVMGGSAYRMTVYPLNLCRWLATIFAMLFAFADGNWMLHRLGRNFVGVYLVHMYFSLDLISIVREGQPYGAAFQVAAILGVPVLYTLSVGAIAQDLVAAAFREILRLYGLVARRLQK
jgi:hypothetical protein